MFCQVAYGHYGGYNVTAPSLTWTDGDGDLIEAEIDKNQKSATVS